MSDRTESYLEGKLAGPILALALAATPGYCPIFYASVSSPVK